MTHYIRIIIDGVEYTPQRKTEHREGDPIPFYITKKDMEYFMMVLDEARDKVAMEWDTDSECYKGLDRMTKAFQTMIDKAIERGEWK